MQHKAVKNILIAPLDWGLGHATRCIPVIDALLKTDSNIIIAANGKPRSVLEEAFPQLTFIAIPDYGIRYGKTTAGTILKLITQFVKIRKAIALERRWLEEKIGELDIDIVISDNRYGFCNKKVKSVFITHQLKPKGFFGSFGEGFLQNKLYRFINQFDLCWVIDNIGNNNLAGDLSHPVKMPLLPTVYIGPQTRLKALVEKEKFIYCFLVSGPEPQRSLFEKMALEQMQKTNEKGVLIRGLPDQNPPLATPNTNHTIYNHLNAEALCMVLAQSRYIICRSGYSSVMDLLLLHKKCIFIPTPGQTEQVYLAAYLSRKNYGISIKQNRFDLKDALFKAEKFPFAVYSNTTNTTPISTSIENLLKD